MTTVQTALSRSDAPEQKPVPVPAAAEMMRMRPEQAAESREILPGIREMREVLVLQQTDVRYVLQQIRMIMHRERHAQLDLQRTQKAVRQSEALVPQQTERFAESAPLVLQLQQTVRAVRQPEVPALQQRMEAQDALQRRQPVRVQLARAPHRARVRQKMSRTRISITIS